MQAAAIVVAHTGSLCMSGWGCFATGKAVACQSTALPGRNMPVPQGLLFKTLARHIIHADTSCLRHTPLSPAAPFCRPTPQHSSLHCGLRRRRGRPFPEDTVHRCIRALIPRGDQQLLTVGMTAEQVSSSAASLGPPKLAWVTGAWRCRSILWRLHCVWSLPGGYLSLLRLC